MTLQTSDRRSPSDSTCREKLECPLLYPRGDPCRRLRRCLRYCSGVFLTARHSKAQKFYSTKPTASPAAELLHWKFLISGSLEFLQVRPTRSRSSGFVPRLYTAPI